MTMYSVNRLDTPGNPNGRSNPYRGAAGSSLGHPKSVRIGSEYAGFWPMFHRLCLFHEKTDQKDIPPP